MHDRKAREMTITKCSSSRKLNKGNLSIGERTREKTEHKHGGGGGKLGEKRTGKEKSSKKNYNKEKD